ncbi:MAG: glycosyltransferase family 39 protein [Butyrivibrio sp.]|nr:glycosyltransferase family 39 protein [Butyrivibrio sp.]
MHKLELHKNNICYHILFGIITTAGLLMYISLMKGRYIWADEAYTFSLIKHSYAQICKITAADVHPPLYYILLKFCIQPFNYSHVAAKLFSIIPFVLILVIGGERLKKIFDEKVSLIFMTLFLFFPFLLAYAVEIRMYSLAAFFVFINGLYAYEYYGENAKKDYWIWVVSGVCASYTHYFAMVSVGIIYCVLFVAICLKKRRILKQWFAAVLITAVLYLPWIGSFIGQLVYKVNNDYWISEITRWTIKEYAITVFSAAGFRYFEILALCSYIIVSAFVIFSGNKKAIALSVCALSVPAGTIIVGVAASLLVRPVFVIRYVIPAVPFLIVFMAVGLSHVKVKALAAFIWIIALCGGVSNYKENLQAESLVVENPIDKSFVDECASCDSYVIQTALPQAVYGVLSYYAPDKPVYVDAPVTAAEPYDNLANIEEFDLTANGEIILLLDSGGGIPDKFADSYNCSFFKEVFESGTWVDVYRLTRK